MIHCGISSNILLLADAAVCYYWQQKLLGIRHCSKDERNCFNSMQNCTLISQGHNCMQRVKQPMVKIAATAKSL